MKTQVKYFTTSDVLEVYKKNACLFFTLTEAFIPGGHYNLLKCSPLLLDKELYEGVWVCNSVSEDGKTIIQNVETKSKKVLWTSTQVKIIGGIV